MAGLEVEIGADIKNFQNKIKEVENDIKDLAKEKAVQIKLGLDTKEITAQIKDAKKYLNDLKQTAKDTGASFQKDLAPKVANGSNALMQFSRIAQDAPFGIMGIGNNITATVEAFSHLQASTGSAGGALKAVASSILGSGGILLAVSLVTTGLTIMSQKGLTVNDVFAKLTGTFDENRAALQKMNVEVAKNAQGDISGMNAYLAVAKDVNLSMQDRLIAVKKLQDEYPAYFGNLTKEQILNGNVASTVKEVTAALIARAKATALTERIVKLAEEEEKISNDLKNEILSIARAYSLNKKEAFEFAKAVKNGADAFKLLEPFKKRAGFFDVAGAVSSSNSIKSLTVDLEKNRFQQDRLTASLEKQTAAQIKLEAVKEKAAKKPNVTPQVQALEVPIKIKPLIDLNGAQIKTAMTSIVQPISDEFVRLLELLDSFNKSASDLITGSIASTFSDLGTAIGESLANGTDVIGEIGKSLISSLGGFISSMGDLLIKYGTLAVAKGVIDKALTSGNPVVTIAAGAAAIAVGVALKAAGGAISTKASGGGAMSDASTGSGYSSPASRSSATGGNSSFSNGSVVFEISGSSLIGVLRNTYDQNLRLGGANGL